MAKIVQIGQQQRCGGTLLLRTLGNHPQLAVDPNECYFSYPFKYHPPFFESHWTMGDVWQRNFDPNLRSFQRYGYDLAAHRKRFCGAEQASRSRRDVVEQYAATLFRAMSRFARAEQPDGYVFFSPRRALWIEELAASGEVDVMIQVLRHPLGYFASAYHHNRYYSSFAAKLVWRVHFFSGLYFAGRITQLLLVRFEDLVKSPEAELRRICQAMELPFSPALLVPKHEGRDWHGDSSFGRLQGIAEKTSDQYRNRLAEDLQREWGREAALYEEYLGSSATPGGTEAFLGRHKALLDAVLEFLVRYKRARPIATSMFFPGWSLPLISRIVEAECTEALYAGLEILSRDEAALLFEDAELNVPADMPPASGQGLSADRLLELEPRLRGAILWAYARVGGLPWRRFGASRLAADQERALVEDVKLALQVDARGVRGATLSRLALSRVGSVGHSLQHVYGAAKKKLTRHFEAHASWPSGVFHLVRRAAQKLLRGLGHAQPGVSGR